MEKNFKLELSNVPSLFDEELMKDLQSPSFYNNAIEDFFKKTFEKFNKNLKEYLQKNLQNICYRFSNDEEFYEFCRERITRIVFDEKPNYFEFYLDFKNTDDRGILIGSYCDKVDIVNEGNKITAYIGKHPHHL